MIDSFVPQPVPLWLVMVFITDREPVVGEPMGAVYPVLGWQQRNSVVCPVVHMDDDGSSLEVMSPLMKRSDSRESLLGFKYVSKDPTELELKAIVDAMVLERKIVKAMG